MCVRFLVTDVGVLAHNGNPCEFRSAIHTRDLPGKRPFLNPTGTGISEEEIGIGRLSNNLAQTGELGQGEIESIEGSGYLRTTADGKNPDYLYRFKDGSTALGDLYSPGEEIEKDPAEPIETIVTTVLGKVGQTEDGVVVVKLGQGYSRFINVRTLEATLRKVVLASTNLRGLVLLNGDNSIIYQNFR